MFYSFIASCLRSESCTINFAIMLKLIKESEVEVEDMQKAASTTFDHKLLARKQEYRLEASVDILKLYNTLNNLELDGPMSSSTLGVRNSSSWGMYGGHNGVHSPIIIFPDELQHPSATMSMPNTDGGSVSSTLSPLSNTNIISTFATEGGDEKQEITQV